MSQGGKFFPRNPQKYMGDANNIIFRSMWERTFMERCDRMTNILKWGSEELPIPYYFPIDQRMHKYYPDFIIQVLDTDNKVRMWMVEIKPAKQLTPPKTPKRKNTKRHLRESVEYVRNQHKWNAAKAFCAARGWKFVVLTEKDLYPEVYK